MVTNHDVEIIHHCLQDKYSTDSKPESEQHFNKQAYGQEKFRRRNERRHDATVQDHALRMRQGKKTVLLYETKKPQVLFFKLSCPQGPAQPKLGQIITLMHALIIHLCKTMLQLD